MPLRFVLAPAGGGKTHHCLTQLSRLETADPLGEHSYFILPEQATFIHERLLAGMTKGGGFCRARVTSFGRLIHYAYRARRLEPKEQLSEAGKLLLAGRIINTLKDQLEIYAAASTGAGFAVYVVKAAEELATYDISPAALIAAISKLCAQNGDTLQVRRLQEIALIYQNYQAAQQDNYGSYAENMAFLAESIEEGFLPINDLFIDGYLEFTPSEQIVLAALFSDASRNITIALPIDRALIGQPLQEPLFQTALHTWQQLSELAAKQRMAVSEPLLLRGEPGRFSHNSELAAVEAAFAGRRQQPFSAEPHSVHLGCAANPRAEIEAIGREIMRLTREEGLRYREISVITRDTDSYEPLLSEIFAQMDIPYFIDAKKPLLLHPLFDLVRAVLENWAYRSKYEHIMRLCKNALLPFSQEEIDIFDNYALAHGLKFWHFLSEKPWDFPLYDDEDPSLVIQMEELRQRITAPLIKLLKRLNKPSTVAEVNAALLQFLADFAIKEKVELWAETAREEGRGAEAAQHGQVWDKLMAFFTEATLLLGAETFPANQLLRLYDTALMGMTVSTIPPGLDQVFISSLERSRNAELQAAFVPTVNDGILPRKIVMDGLFTDEDRRSLRACGASLAIDSINRQLQEDYLAYIALTRSGERLYLSYSAQDMQGKAMKPSSLIRRMQALFPQLMVTDLNIIDQKHLLGGELDLAETAWQMGRSQGGEDIDAFWYSVYSFYQQRPQYQEQLDKLQKGLNYQPQTERLSAKTLQKLYGGTIRSSVSRLEKYRMCPFAYFAGHGLKLHKRKSYQLDPASRGELYHQVLADIGSHMREQRLSWADIDAAAAEALVEQSLQKYLPQLLAGILRSSSRYLYLAERIKGALVSSVLLLTEHAKKGDFVPVAWELPFGSNEPGSLPAFKISLPDNKVLELVGRIDRVDMAKSADGSKSYFRIIDYKSGEISLREEDILAGLQLQLLVYLQVVLENADVFSPDAAHPAGIYYARVSDALANSDSDDNEVVGLKLSGLTVRDEEAILLADKEIDGLSDLIPAGLGKKGLYSRPKGLDPEQMPGLRDNLLDVISETAGQMLDGLIAVSPLRDGDFDACAYCDYSAVCGFDCQMAAARKKELKKPASNSTESNNAEGGEIYETEF